MTHSFSRQSKQFRDIDELCEQVRCREASSSEEDDNQPQNGQDDHDIGDSDDELTPEQQAQIGEQILDSIKFFREKNKISED